MFGEPDTNQQTAAPAAQTTASPSMLDGISSQDIQSQSTQPTTSTSTASPPAPSADPQAKAFAQQHPLTTDNPFTAQPTAQTSTPLPTPAPTVALDDQGDDTSTTNPVDHDKLATMKQEAMTHLEPLVDHIDNSPEETFKTTMMMIQANDNHTLLDKAFSAAKSIQNDKARAEALLDIINEINYFSQAQAVEHAEH